MVARHDRESAMTLVELLVVVTIIALVAAIAVPTFARVGAFQRNSVYKTARQLHGLLYAAKVHAATHRVDTAVAYAYQDKDENNNEIPVKFMNVVCIMKKDAGSGRFVPLDDYSGQVRRLPGESGILHQPDKNGLKGITVRADLQDPKWVWRAHVFRPGGYLDTSAAAMRYSMGIYSAPPQLNSDGTVKLVDGLPIGADGDALQTETVELFKAFGRARIKP